MGFVDKRTGYFGQGFVKTKSSNDWENSVDYGSFIGTFGAKSGKHYAYIESKNKGDPSYGKRVPMAIVELE